MRLRVVAARLLLMASTSNAEQLVVQPVSGYFVAVFCAQPQACRYLRQALIVVIYVYVLSEGKVG